MNLKNITLAIGILTISAGTFAQKKNETSAALERNKAIQALSAEKVKEAKNIYCAEFNKRAPSDYLSEFKKVLYKVK